MGRADCFKFVVKLFVPTKFLDDIKKCKIYLRINYKVIIFNDGLEVWSKIKRLFAYKSFKNQFRKREVLLLGPPLWPLPKMLLFRYDVMLDALRVQHLHRNQFFDMAS